MVFRESKSGAVCFRCSASWRLPSLREQTKLAIERERERRRGIPPTGYNTKTPDAALFTFPSFAEK